MPKAVTFMTLDEASDYTMVPKEILEGYCASKVAPHYTFLEKGPLFKKSEISKWVRDNLVKKQPIYRFPKSIDVLVPSDHIKSGPIPISISAIEGLCHLQITGKVSGIYFLCHGSDVVYVGQSSCVVARVATHINEDIKQFDLNRVFFLPTPSQALDSVEREFIKRLKPKYNVTFLPKE